MAFCGNCGKQLAEEAKFCFECGAKVYAPNIDNDKTKRSQEYVGTILKCPHCAAVITEMTALCPDCGLPITKKEAVSSVQAFHNRLMALEKNRKGKVGGIGAAYRKVDPVDTEKLTMIRNYPIPNSIDDIAEFMMLAISNIDVSLSKKTILNMQTTTYETSATIAKTISNAWVAKMEQCYRKAEATFPNHPTFAVVQRAYLSKIEELEGKGVGGFFADMLKF